MDTNFELMKCGSLKDRVKMFKEQSAKSENQLTTNPYSKTYQKPDLKIGTSRYGRPPKGSLTEARGIKAGQKIYKEIMELCEMIDQCGIERPDGCKLIRFGHLFRLYTRISDTVVGMLIRARKYGLVDFEGEMLYQRQDDNKIITMKLPYDEIKLRLRPSGDPKDCIKLVDDPNEKPSEVDEPGEFIEVHGIYKWVKSTPSRDETAEIVEDRLKAANGKELEEQKKKDGGEEGHETSALGTQRLTAAQKLEAARAKAPSGLEFKIAYGEKPKAQKSLDTKPKESACDSKAEETAQASDSKKENVTNEAKEKSTDSVVDENVEKPATKKKVIKKKKKPVADSVKKCDESDAEKSDKIEAKDMIKKKSSTASDEVKSEENGTVGDNKQNANRKKKASLEDASAAENDFKSAADSRNEENSDTTCEVETTETPNDDKTNFDNETHEDTDNSNRIQTEDQTQGVEDDSDNEKLKPLQPILVTDVTDASREKEEDNTPDSAVSADSGFCDEDIHHDDE